MTKERLLQILDGILCWGQMHNKEFRKCLIIAAGITKDELKELELEGYISGENT